MNLNIIFHCLECNFVLNSQIICDNDCGTFLCEHCSNEYHFDNNNKKLIQGHNPKCGDFSDDNLNT